MTGEKEGERKEEVHEREREGPGLTGRKIRKDKQYRPTRGKEAAYELFSGTGKEKWAKGEGRSGPCLLPKRRGGSCIISLEEEVLAKRGEKGKRDDDEARGRRGQGKARKGKKRRARGGGVDWFPPFSQRGRKKGGGAPHLPGKKENNFKRGKKRSCAGSQQEKKRGASSRPCATSLTERKTQKRGKEKKRKEG